MRLHDLAFYIILFFLFGIFIASFKLNFSIVSLIAVLIAVLFLLIGYANNKSNLFWLSGFSLLIIPGAFYCFLWNAQQIKNINIVFDKKIEFQGIVVDYPQTGNAQKLVIELQKPLSGKVLANLPPYPAFKYGDLIKFNGIIKIPQPPEYEEYLTAKNIFGIIDFPKTDLIAKNQGSFFMANLFAFKEKIVANFQKSLSAEKAAFLAGITIGERAEFSKEFKEAMKKSGTIHIVALSGYNITIIAMAVSSVFGFIFKKRLAFYISIIVIIAFVLMTGAEASVVRAAIMGGIILLANQLGRVHSMRNAIAVAAFLMVLFNPNVLRFDLGFQLSFFALMGIVYLAPALQKFLKLKEEKGFLGWRENSLSTVSAQLAVMPILILSAGNFSLFSIIPNILILEVIPLTMFLGFLIAAIGFISSFLAIVFGWFADLLLSYQIIVINIFSLLSSSMFEISILGAIIYYFALAMFIYYQKKAKIDIV